MIGIFAGNLNCLPAFFSTLFSSLCRYFFLLIICSLVFRHGFLCISCNTFAGILGNQREIPQQEFYSRCFASPSLLSLSFYALPSPFDMQMNGANLPQWILAPPHSYSPPPFAVSLSLSLCSFSVVNWRNE